jgi:hypothetical protein
MRKTKKSPSADGMDTEATENLQRSAEIIRGWLDRCRSDHEASPCSFSVSGTWPKRLIWLDPNSDGNRLVDTPVRTTPEYVALSYVWGPTSGNIRTLTANIERMRQTIPFSDLPLTLQHVFYIVRLLKIEYLWIDALCIVQDDEAEMAAEISRMEFVYLNSTLQISAMASHGARHGLVQTRRRCGDLEMEEHHLIMKACRGLRQKIWDERLRRDYCLLTRGWAYQERMLSRRIVHFTLFELLWECKQSRWCECRKIEEPSGMMTNMINNMSAAFEACARVDTPPREHIIPLWRECVMGYSRGHLSEKSDRLPAISGVGRMLGGRDGHDAYVAGMRRDALPFELLWRCDQTSALPLTKARTPSWSWGSVNCGVNWPTREIVTSTEATTEFAKSLAYVVSGTYFEEGLEGAELLGIDAKLAVIGTDDMPRSLGFDRLEYATLTLASRLVPVSVKPHPSSTQWFETHGTRWMIQGWVGRQVMPFYPDIEVGEDEASEVVEHGFATPDTATAGFSLVEIATLESGGGLWEAALVVRPSPGGMLPGCFERIGMAGFSKCRAQEGFESWFGSVTRTTVKLV